MYRFADLLGGTASCSARLDRPYRRAGDRGIYQHLPVRQSMDQVEPQVSTSGRNYDRHATDSSKWVFAVRASLSFADRRATYRPHPARGLIPEIRSSVLAVWIGAEHAQGGDDGRRAAAGKAVAVPRVAAIEIAGRADVGHPLDEPLGLVRHHDEVSLGAAGDVVGAPENDAALNRSHIGSKQPKN